MDDTEYIGPLWREIQETKPGSELLFKLKFRKDKGEPSPEQNFDKSPMMSEMDEDEEKKMKDGQRGEKKYAFITVWRNCISQPI